MFPGLCTICDILWCTFASCLVRLLCNSTHKDRAFKSDTVHVCHIYPQRGSLSHHTHDNCSAWMKLSSDHKVCYNNKPISEVLRHITNLIARYLHDCEACSYGYPLSILTSHETVVTPRFILLCQEHIMWALGFDLFGVVKSLHCSNALTAKSIERYVLSGM